MRLVVEEVADGHRRPIHISDALVVRGREKTVRESPHPSAQRRIQYGRRARNWQRARERNPANI
jgi:hypothetical protein